MKRTLIIVLAVLAAIAIAYLAYRSYAPSEDMATAPQAPLADYAYRCDDGTEFTLTLGGDLSTARIVSPADPARIPETELLATETAAGARFEGGGFIVLGQGETVAFSGERFKTMCHPVPSADSAPFNFGD